MGRIARRSFSEDLSSRTGLFDLLSEIVENLAKTDSQNSRTSAVVLPCSPSAADNPITLSTIVFAECEMSSPFVASLAKLFTMLFAICQAAASPIGSDDASTPRRIACSERTRPA
ncbi:unannotated protein [freshwater metagenome]|uniref:Unannotated protein n=1 Tax=freshwater metagenome TaxID=449393 RepID=A0A6J6BAJ9_9ZZZZ